MTSFAHRRSTAYSMLSGRVYSRHCGCLPELVYRWHRGKKFMDDDDAFVATIRDEKTGLDDIAYGDERKEFMEDVHDILNSWSRVSRISA